jgi:DNA-binding MarR family transcriptional regulator
MQLPVRVRVPTESPAILDDLRRIVRVLRESSRAAEGQLGVSGAQLFVLRTLATAPALSLNAVAARTRTHQSTVSVVVRRLVEAGLVSRKSSLLDARRVSLKLTKRGEQLLERAPLAAQDRLIQGIERLPQQERKRLKTSLHALVLAMQLGDAPPEMFFEEETNKLAHAKLASAKAARAKHETSRSKRSARA